MTDDDNRNPHFEETRLESWKAIAAHLKRDVRTVRRWEKAEGLPVHRQLHLTRSSVYAYASELDVWRATRRPAGESPASGWFGPHARALALASLVILALVSPGGGRVIPATPATAAQERGMVARQLPGPGADPHAVPSPDGRYLLYGDPATGDLIWRDLNSAETRRISAKLATDEAAGTPLWPILSPDGKEVVYAWGTDENTVPELRLISINGSNPRIVHRNDETAAVQPEAWSPDGMRVLAQLTRKDGANQIAWIALADGSVRVVKTLDWRYPFEVRLSPDGRYIAYDLAPREDSPERDIFLLTADGSRETSVVQHSANDFLLGWAPDGQHLLFASDRTGTLGVWVVQVVDGRPQGSPELLRKDVGRIRPLGVTRNGAFYYLVATWMNDASFAVLDLATGTVLARPANASERWEGSTSLPTWSPDGEYVAYVTQPPDVHFSTGLDARIIVRSLKTREERELWPQLNQISFMSWSPDGRSLLLTGFDKNVAYNQSVYRMDVGTGKVIPVVQTKYEATLSNGTWSAEGRAIFYVRDQSSTKRSYLLVRTLDTGQEKELHAAPWLAGGLALSPDGSQVAIIETDRRGLPHTDRLLLVPAGGGQARELHLALGSDEHLFDVAWTPEATAVLFVQGRLTGGQAPSSQGELWRISPAGGEPQRLGLLVDAPLVMGRSLRVHPDGQRVAFTSMRFSPPQLWVMENFLPPLKAGR